MHLCALLLQEFARLLSTLCRGSIEERLCWIFSLYDADNDGVLNRADVTSVVQAVYNLMGASCTPPVHFTTVPQHVTRIFFVSNAEKNLLPSMAVFIFTFKLYCRLKKIPFTVTIFTFYCTLQIPLYLYLFPAG